MPARDIAAFLRQRSVFAAVPAREIDAVAALTVEESHRARSYIFMEGDPDRWFYVVRSGHVKIVRHSKTGKDVVLEILGPGEIFGGIAVIEKRPYPAAAQTTESTVVLKIPAEPMIALAERHPALIKEMALVIGRRLREGKRDEKTGAVALPLRLSRQSLADMTGTTVETAIRTVSRWLKDGLLVDEGGQLVLTDLEELSERAAGHTE